MSGLIKNSVRTSPAEMTYAKYVQQIRFHPYKPDSVHRILGKFLKLLRRFYFPLEIKNTDLPHDGELMRERLLPLFKIPRMSTYAIGAMINFGVSRMPSNTCFLNVGVWNGFTFFSGIIGNSEKQCLGVDDFSQFGSPRQRFLKNFAKYKSPNHHFYDMNYEEYFSKTHTEEIGFYVYDGEHSFENHVKGLQLAEPFFSNDCIVLVDDTNWFEARQGIDAFFQKSPNRYEILLDQRTSYNGHPTLWNGIMIFKRSG